MKISLVNSERLTGLHVEIQRERVSVTHFHTGDLRDLPGAGLSILVAAGGDISIRGLPPPLDNISIESEERYSAEREVEFLKIVERRDAKCAVPGKIKPSSEP
jgi:hypothetical protein